MSEQARVRISLGTGELEVEGTEEFVAQYEEPIQFLIGRLKNQPVETIGSAGTSGGGSPSGGSGGLEVAGQEFGELLHSLPNGVSGSDQMLVAGWFVQQGSAEKTFATGEANQLLVGQGIKLSNPSQSLKNAIAAKRVFKVGSRYKVSKVGEDHLKTLIAA